MKQYLFYAVVLLLMLSLGFSTACEKKNNSNSSTNSSDTIKIGEYYPLTGELATFGQFARKGIELARLQANQAGGLLGKQIEVIVEDDRGLQQEATIVVQKLIDKDRVVAVLGESASTNSIAGGQVCQERKIPMISPSSTNPQVTQVGDYIFRVCFLDDFQGEVMARFAINTLKIKRVALLQDNSNDYSLGLAKYFAEAFKKMGGEIVLTESYQKSDVDFSAQLTKIKSANVEAIYVPGYYTQVGQIAQQARRAGIKEPLLGGDGWDSPTLIEIGKDALNGCFFSNHYTLQDTDNRVQTFVKAYQQQFNGESPDAMASLAYDAARILFDAIKRANSTDGKAIRDALSQTRDFQGVTGITTIGPSRDAIKSAVIVEIENGQYKVKEKLSPLTDNGGSNEPVAAK